MSLTWPKLSLLPFFFEKGIYVLLLLGDTNPIKWKCCQNFHSNRTKDATTKSPAAIFIPHPGALHSFLFVFSSFTRQPYHQAEGRGWSWEEAPKQS